MGEVLGAFLVNGLFLGSAWILAKISERKLNKHWETTIRD